MLALYRLRNHPALNNLIFICVFFSKETDCKMAAVAIDILAYLSEHLLQELGVWNVRLARVGVGVRASVCDM